VLDQDNRTPPAVVRDDLNPVPKTNLKPTDPKLKQTLERLLQQMPRQWRESPSGQKFLDEALDLFSKPSDDPQREQWLRQLGENLGELLRDPRSSRWLNEALRSAESAWSKLDLKLQAGDAPSVQAPDLGGSGGGRWSFSSPQWPTTPGAVDGLSDLLFWPTVLVAGVGLIVLLLYRAGWLAGPTKQQQAVALPLDPWQIRTPQELIQVYDQLALARYGESVRPLHHRAIAERLASVDPDAAELARQFYERARYAPEPGLSERDILAARIPLTRLARPAPPDPPRRDDAR
jgi:hypothetical protein